MISPNQTDEKLLNALRMGSRQAFEEIFNRYWYQLFKIACSRTKSREEAEEIVQDIFAALWKNRKTLLITNLSFYLFASVRKGVISNVRTKLVHEKYWNYYAQFFKKHSFATQETVEFDDLNDAVEKAIDKLPEKSQKVFRLNRLQGLSVSEIAKMLNIPKRTIEHHLTKSIRELRIVLKDYLLFLFIFLHIV